MIGPETLGALFALESRDPTAVFLEVPGGEVLTYGDAVRGSAQVAHALGALGVQPGDRVAVQVEKSPLAVLVYLACVRAGAVQERPSSSLVTNHTPPCC